MKSPESRTTSQPAKKASPSFFGKDGDAFFSGRKDSSSGSFFSGSIQPKLTVGAPNDKYEREADFMADQVVQRLNNPQTLQTKPNRQNSVNPMVHMKCAECEKEEKVQNKAEEGKEMPEEKKLQRKPIFESNAKKVDDPEKIQKSAAPNASSAARPSLANSLSTSKGSGDPLPASTLWQMESSFKTDFSNVRVHKNETAIQMNRDLRAQAFTNGNDIYFNSAKYDPGSNPGKHLLAHELTHVIQQGNQNQPNVQRRFLDERSERQKIDDALLSKDPADVKDIVDVNQAKETEKLSLLNILAYQGWAGYFDETKMEEIWTSFGGRLTTVASDNIKLWEQCVNKGADLNDLPVPAAIKNQFEPDIKSVVTSYLFQNRLFAVSEIKRLGLPATGATDQKGPTPEQENEIKKMQDAAKEIAKLQSAQEKVKGNILVGYEPNSSRSSVAISDRDPNMPSFSEPTFLPVFFDPYKKPRLNANPEDGLTAKIGIKSAEVIPFDLVKNLYDLAGEQIADYLQLYPSLYAISREGKSANTAAFAGTNPGEARKQLGDGLLRLIASIEEAQLKLDAGELNPLDLIPIHGQLMDSGIQGSSGTDWTNPLAKYLAKGLVADHDFNNALKAMALELASEALFMIAPLTGGGAIFVLLAGAAVAGTKSYLSTQQYEALANAAKTSIIPGTELVGPQQVDEAKMTMESDQIALAFAALAVGLHAATSAYGALKNYSIKLELRQTAATVRTQYLGKPFPKGNVASAKAVLEDGTQMGFAETSRQKSPLVKEPPLPKSKGGQFEPSVDPAKQGGPVADTDPEYKILSSASEILEKQHGKMVKGKLYLYSERQLCVSCNDVLGQFKAKFPNMEVKVFFDVPYPQ